MQEHFVIASVVRYKLISNLLEPISSGGPVLRTCYVLCTCSIRQPFHFTGISRGPSHGSCRSGACPDA